MSRVLVEEGALGVTRAAGTDAAPPARSRLDSVDLVRGLVMVIMALDHVRGEFSNIHFDITDVSQTTPWAFFTRWVTNFCAPTFVFLAGTGGFLYGARGRSTRQVSWFLFSRGLWLILLELTVIRFSWTGNFTYDFSFGQVIWAIGWSMVVLSGLVYLPLSAVAVFGVATIGLHNLFDHVSVGDWGRLGWLWAILHTGETFEVVAGRKFSPFYPLVPWIGVMAAGYAFGAMLLMDRSRRRRELLGLGIALLATFVALRFTNAYGDKATPRPGTPGPWAVQPDGLATLMSFINCQKYPPSLLFCLMTLGAAVTAVGLFDRPVGTVGRFFVVFGRVPLFFYLLHWPVLKVLGIAVARLRYGRSDWYFGGPGVKPPEDNGFELWAVYLFWLLVVAVLFPACYWFAGVKRRSRAAWLSYF